MWQDWWIAHRAELLLSAIVLPVLIPIVLAMKWWEIKQRQKQEHQHEHEAALKRGLKRTEDLQRTLDAMEACRNGR